MFSRRRFNIRNRANLWDSSDEEDDVIHIASSSEPSVRSDNDTMVVATTTNDLPSLLPPPSSSAVQYQQQQPVMAGYVPRTLQSNSRRYSILPAFPTSIYNNQPPLLMANVPQHNLSEMQLARRRQNAYPLQYIRNRNNFDIPSYFWDDHQAFISSLIYQYNVDEPTLDYNLRRFSQWFRTFGDNYSRRFQCPSELFDLNERQKKYALEFYLQIDVDLFFMKTCSYRGAKPRSINEGLFCLNEPDVRYGLLPCDNCPLCVPPYPISRREYQPIIRFTPSQKYRFQNGYQAILNCPANCQTQNIIYVMTCPCGDYEYIGESSQRLWDRLRYHRQHFNRIIHEFLIGEENVELTQKVKDDETTRKDRMLLYKHAARCPSAMQIFLNFNPIYWCFVPITMSEATRQSRNYLIPSSIVLLDSINPTSIASKDPQARLETKDRRSDEKVRSCMRNLPSLPPGYTYSIRQRIEQFQYFKNQLDNNVQQDQFIDLFNVSIIAVLPYDASEGVRRFVEALFITHTEAKLNTAGRLLHLDDDNDDSNVKTDSIPSRICNTNRGVWCRNLVFH